VGTIEVFPASRNIIPEKATITLDLRDIDLERRNQYEVELKEKIESIAKKHRLTFTLSEDTRSDPRYCAEWIRNLIREETIALGLDAPELMSGPFHDALALSYACDYGMIFVRCKDGISHNPLEYASWEDLALGAEVLSGTVSRILSQTR
jgi:allantoate deiminase/N-carbamoyl-L-amino-acid hydrolase